MSASMKHVFQYFIDSLLTLKGKTSAIHVCFPLSAIKIMQLGMHTITNDRQQHSRKQRHCHTVFGMKASWTVLLCRYSRVQSFCNAQAGVSARRRTQAQIPKKSISSDLAFRTLTFSAEPAAARIWCGPL
jgi:hypothetical protein